MVVPPDEIVDALSPLADAAERPEANRLLGVEEVWPSRLGWEPCTSDAGLVRSSTPQGGRATRWSDLYNGLPGCSADMRGISQAAHGG